MSSKQTLSKNPEANTKTNSNQKPTTNVNPPAVNKGVTESIQSQALTNVKSNELITKVFVENFPSRIEIFTLLDNYLQKNGYKKDYTSDNKDNKIIFIFKNPVFISYNFLGHWIRIR